VFEGDLAKIAGLPLRFLIDTGISGGYEHLNGKLKPIEVSQVLRYWLIDFECVSELRYSVNPKRDEPIIMATVYDSFDKTFITLHTHMSNFEPMGDDHIVWRYPTEEELLMQLFRMLDGQDPELIAAHNLYRYDIIKWVDRIKRNGLDPDRLSPKAFRSTDLRKKISIKGRILFDTLPAFILYTNKDLPEYSLAYIIESQKLPFPKIAFNHSINDLWNDTAKIDPEELKYMVDQLPKEMKKRFKKVKFRSSYIIFLRNYLDVKAMLAFLDKQPLIEFYNSLRINAGCLFNEVFVKHKQVDAALLRQCKGRVILPSTNPKSGKGGGFKAGLVVDPEPGEYHNIACVDFTREYPSIIRAGNISPEKFVPCTSDKPLEWAKTQLAKGRFVVTYKSTVYAFKIDSIGIIPKLVTHFWKQRDKFEAMHSEALEKSPKLAKSFWYRAFQCKQTLNAVFGVMSYSPFRLFRNECSAAIGLTGYLGAEKTIEILTELGYEVIYGDTDSVFFKKRRGETIEDLQKVVIELNKRLGVWAKKTFNARMNPYVASLKRLYKTFVIPTRKHYCGRYGWDEKEGYLKKDKYEWKGLDAIRSNSSALERDTLKTILKLIMDRKRNRVTQINQLYISVLDSLERREYTIFEVGYPAKIAHTIETFGKVTKPTGYKKNLPCHIKAVIYSNLFLGTEWRTGDKPMRVPIKAELLRKFPRKFKAHTFKGLKEYTVNSIATDPAYFVPEQFFNAINWVSITKRLKGKVENILNKCNIPIDKPKPKTTMDQFCE